ncbi:PKHN1 protein, partial [Calcarius ornatus]|nr:PKHN1 protein [Calcarius ornatus]
PGMGNIACVPQAPGGFRSSFRRKPSLKKDPSWAPFPGLLCQESLLGRCPGNGPSTSPDLLLPVSSAQIYQKQENQKENLDQRFPSLFRKGRRKTVVRNLGKMIYYSKVKFRFQHCQPCSAHPGSPAPGPLLNPLVVFCQSQAELKQWLYHLEKQIQLCGGSLALPLLSQ